MDLIGFWALILIPGLVLVLAATFLGSRSSGWLRLGLPILAVVFASVVGVVLWEGPWPAFVFIVAAFAFGRLLYSFNTCPVCGKTWVASQASLDGKRDQRHFDCKFVTPEA